MNKLEKWLLFWTLFIGIGALWGTCMMWIDPTGKMWGMQDVLPALQILPFADLFFKDFIWSGVALLLVNGVPQFVAAILLLKRHTFAAHAVMFSGIFLILWISLQFVIFPLNPLSSICFVFGLTEFLMALALLRKKIIDKNPNNFWDIVAPIYDFAQKSGFDRLLATIKKQIPEKATVLECAAGTGSISMAIADKAQKIFCTDISAKMLAVAKKKIATRGIKNIEISICDIYQTGFADNEFDVVIASQVLHLLADPQKAVDELKRICKGKIIVAIRPTKEFKKLAKLKISLWKLIGFAPKYEFDTEEFKKFLGEIGLHPCYFELTAGSMPVAVAIIEK